LPLSCPSSPSLLKPRAAAVDELRRRLARMEGVPKEEGRLAFGLPALDTHLPRGGLAFGAVHEIGPETEADMPAALGFLIALLGRIPAGAPLVLIRSRTLRRIGTLHGHGLAALGLDPARAILIEPRTGPEALWATEETLRSAVPAAVASAIGDTLDLKAGQRLLHAARETRIPLLLLRPHGTGVVATATTRWRIAAAPGRRDRFGMMSAWRWRASLERCRNGRPGDWMLEFDHGTHRFGLAAPMAGASLPEIESPGETQREQAG